MAITYQGGNDAVVTGNFGGLMQVLQRNYQYEQQQKQESRKQQNAILQESQKDLAKINSNGLRQADLPAFDEKYNSIKGIYYKMLTSQSPTEQRSLAMQINQGLGEINSLVAQSKETMKWENSAIDKFTSMAGHREERAFIDHVRKGYDLPSSKLSKEYFDNSPFVDRWDEGKANSAMTKGIQDAWKNSSNYTSLAPQVGATYNVGQRRVADVSYKDTLNDNVVLDLASKLYQNNKDVRGQVDSLITSGNAADLNQALSQYAMKFSEDFERTKVSHGVNTEKAKGATINVNMPSPAVSSNYYTNQIGNFTSNQSATYSEDVPLVGTREVYTKDGSKYPVEFKGESMRGGVLMTLPVDSKGAPLPTDSTGEATDKSKVAGYGEFLGGVLPRPENMEESKVVDGKYQSLFSDNALLPMSQIQWIGQSKPKRADLQGKQNQSREQTQKLQTQGRVR